MLTKYKLTRFTNQYNTTTVRNGNLHVYIIQKIKDILENVC